MAAHSGLTGTRTSTLEAFSKALQHRDLTAISSVVRLAVQLSRTSGSYSLTMRVCSKRSLALRNTRQSLRISYARGTSPSCFLLTARTIPKLLQSLTRPQDYSSQTAG